MDVMDKERKVAAHGDSFTVEGAKRAIQKIYEWWYKYYPNRAKNLKVWYEEGPYTPSMRSSRVDIRSNIVNGYPPL